MTKKLPFDDKEIIYREGWEKKLLDMWMYVKLRNLDLKGTTSTSREKWLNKFNMNENRDFEMIKRFNLDKKNHTKVCIIFGKEYDSDTVNTFKHLIKGVEKYIVQYNELTLEFGWEHWDLEDNGNMNTIIIKK